MSSCRATNEKRETWRKGWSYYAGVESPANSPDADGLLLPLAGCSPKCADDALEKVAAGLPTFSEMP